MNRVEDPRFLRGQGRYLDDIKLPGMLHAAIVRSPHAHARIVSIDTSKAEALPGVVRVVTGKDVDRARGAAAVLRRRADRAGHDRDREGAPLRRDRRGRDRRGPLHRRGRVRADRGRLRAAAGRCSTRSPPGRGRAARPRGARDEHRLRAHVHLRRGRQGVRATPRKVTGEALLAALDRDADGHERRHRRLRPRHRRRDDPRQLDELHVLPLADRGVAEDPGEQAQRRSRSPRAAASARSSSCTRCRRSPGSCRCSSASR